MMSSRYLAGQPRFLVLHLLQNYPTRTFTPRGYQKLLGIDAAAELQLFQELVEEDLLRPYVCECCGETLAEIAELDAELQRPQLPELNEHDRAELARGALMHLGSVAGPKFPFIIEQITLPHWTAPNRLRSVVHLSVAVKSIRVLRPGELFTDEEKAAVGDFTETRPEGYRAWEANRWLRDKYLDTLGDLDERICVSVSGLVID